MSTPLAKRQKSEGAYGQAKMSLGNDMTALSKWEESPDNFKRKCKIVCTMGPNADKGGVPFFLDMIDAGMNIMRLNFSHGDFEEHGGRVKNLREAQKQRPNKP